MRHTSTYILSFDVSRFVGCYLFFPNILIRRATELLDPALAGAAAGAPEGEGVAPETPRILLLYQLRSEYLPAREAGA